MVVRGPELLPAITSTTEELTNPEPLIVNVKLLPPADTLGGEMLEMDGTGLLAALTFSVSVALCCRLPDIPVTVSVNVPACADDEAMIVRVEEPLPPEGGVTLVGENIALTPLGAPETFSVVALLKPFRLLMVTEEVALLPLPPAVTDREFGEMPMPKPAAGLAETVTARLAV